MENRYFVVEHATGIVRAASPTLRVALRYSTPERFIAGPMSVMDFHRLFPRGFGKVKPINTRDDSF